jgi:flagellar motor switch protein FliN
MTEAAAAVAPSEPLEFLQLWAASFSQVVAQITGAASPCEIRSEAPPDLTPPGETDFWAGVTSSGGLRGELISRLAGATVLRLAQIFMSEPAAPEVPLTSDHKDAVVELLRQVSGIVASSAKARWGEIQLLVEQAAAAPSWSSAGTFWLQIGEEGPNSMALEFGLSAALVAQLKAEKTVSAPVETAATASASTSAASNVPLNDSVHGTGALDRLMDVHLAITLRFGAKILLLREVLDLAPGSVVELDRKIQDPVDLLLDGRLVARGEVVVIDGSYGLRVTDVSPLGPA